MKLFRHICQWREQRREGVRTTSRLFQYSVNCRARQLTLPMLSTVITYQSRKFRVVSKLSALLDERGRTQRDLAKATGLSPWRINRIVRRHVVTQIICHTAVKVCLALSSWPRLRDRRSVRVG